ncbi:hypothetical protein [Chitinophaga tropicalis]|uniref:Uncharacterized protein n=1 Tax=Chitinophaga tropicalis TaxID=2683588 RepID=A0A7K1U2D2_9BACT|nr:hypothetical protein [Chitinophaga tropicalis]MVT08532.1 hypothetical protein [Chitinophaga tropicalis]
MNTFNVIPSEIDSFEAQYKNVIFRNNNLIIPYINIGVPGHYFDKKDDTMFFFDYCYIVLINVSFLSVFIEKFKTLIVLDSDLNSEKYHFGGNYLDIETKIFNDMAVSCEHGYLQTLEFTKYWESSLLFTNLEEAKLSTKLISEFLEHKFMPDDIKKLIL